MSSKSTEFVTNLHMLCGNPETYQKIIEIAQYGTSKTQLDPSAIQNIATIFDRVLPQTSIQSNSGMPSFAGPMGVNFGPPAINGYQMSAPSFNPGAIPGQVVTAAGKTANFYTETDFRNMINSGKQVCCKVWGPTSAKKGGYCCGEIKSYDQSKPADQQLCNTHNRSSKSKTPAMSSTGIANAFTNFGQTFAQPLGMQQGMINPSMTPQGFGSIPNNGMQQNQIGMNNGMVTPQGFGGVPGQMMQQSNMGFTPNGISSQGNGQSMNNQFQQNQFGGMNSVQQQQPVTMNGGIPTQQNPLGIQTIQIPQFGQTTPQQNNQTSQQTQQQNNVSFDPLNQMKQANKDPFVIPSQQGVSLVPPGNQNNQPSNNSLGNMSQQSFNPLMSQSNTSFQQNQNTISQQQSAPGMNQQMFQQGLQSSQSQPQNQFMLPNQQFSANIPQINIGQSEKKSEVPSINPLTNSVQGQQQFMLNQNSSGFGMQVPSIPSISLNMGSQNPLVSTSTSSYNPLTQGSIDQQLSSVSSQFNNMSVSSNVQQNSSQISNGVTHRYFTRKLGNEEYSFSTDPVASGLVFENTLNGFVCVGVIKVPVAEKADPLPNEFKDMVGYQFTMDQENWLQRNNIQKRDIQTNNQSNSVADEYQGTD